MTNKKNKSRAKPIKDITLFDLELSDVQIAWIAGLLEGEGTFNIDSRSQTRFKDSTAPPSPTLKLSMTDQDVVDKFAVMVKKNPFRSRALTTGGKVEHILTGNQYESQASAA